MDQAWIGFLSGLVLASCVSLGIGWLQTPNISDAELYRFCMKNNVKLEECKIPNIPHVIVEKRNDR